MNALHDLSNIPLQIQRHLEKLQKVSKNTAANIEISVSAFSLLTNKHIEQIVHDYLISLGEITIPSSYTSFSDSANTDSSTLLSTNIESIEISITDDNEVNNSDGAKISYSSLDPKFHIFRIVTGDEAGPINVDVEIDEQKVIYGKKWILPNENLNFLWDSLVFDSPIKQNLLNYSETALLFADRKVSPSIVCWNRMILLHGPPGTGKTTLCQALANKLAIRLSNRYDAVQLFEISTENLLSKWFSESAKFVSAMFNSMEIYLEDPTHLICLLVDEVESLVSTRNLSSANEPSDALRVVNTMLTHIDRLRRYPNVLIMTTSNITGVLDSAFLDRADMKLFVGNPTVTAIYIILHSCIAELVRVGIILESNTVDFGILKYQALDKIAPDNVSADTINMSHQLLKLAEKCLGCSGRTIRKLPLIAHAFHLSHTSETCSLNEFITALDKSIPSILF